MLDFQDHSASFPPLEEGELSHFSGVVQLQHSSSFMEQPFQTNGSCGYGHSDTEHDTDNDSGDPRKGEERRLTEEKDFESIPSHQPSQIKYDTSIANGGAHGEQDAVMQESDSFAPYHESESRDFDTTREGASRFEQENEDEYLESSGEAHRYDDAITQESIVIPASPQKIEPVSSGAPAPSFQTAVEDSRDGSPTPVPEEASIQVPGTPASPLARSPEPASTPGEHSQLSIDVSAFGTSQVATIKKIVKIKEECPEDPDLLREALRPFHNPSEIEAMVEEVNISVDISPPGTPMAEKERLSTQEALESPLLAPLLDITEKPAIANGAGNTPETNSNGRPSRHSGHENVDDALVAADGDRNNSNGSESGLLGNGSPSAFKPDNSIKPADFMKTDTPLPAKQRHKTGVLFRRKRSSSEKTDEGKPARDAMPPPKPPQEQKPKEPLVFFKPEPEEEFIRFPTDDEYASAFPFPSTMPEKSLTSGKIALSGRNDKLVRESIVPVYPIDDDGKIGPPEPLPRAVLEVVRGNAKVKIKPQMIKKRQSRPPSNSSDAFGSQRSSYSSSQG